MTITQRRGLLLAATALTTCGLAAPGWAGVLAGRISDSTGIRALGGAQIRILENNRVTEAASDGSFRFPDLDAGRYTVRATYAGAQAGELTIDVPADGVADAGIALEPAAAAGLESVLVMGQQATLASSISRQKASDTVENVLSRDAIGQFPDQNVAESVRRAPGVNVLNDQGEGRFISVRGLDPNLNSASINGVRIMAPEADVRSVALDVLPSELVESIEIKKTLTPDMDGDTIGASIEINTTSAFERRKPFVSVTAEGSFNNLNGNWSPKGAIDFSTTLADRLGISGGFSYYKRNFSTDNVEMDGWDETDDGVAYADTVEYRDYDVRRTRVAGSLSFDYKLTDNTTLFLRGLYSRFEDQEFRKRLTLEMDEEPSSGDATHAAFLSDDGAIKVTRDLKDRFETQSIASFTWGGETFAGPWTFNYQGSYTRSQENNHGSLDPIEFVREFEEPGELGMRFDYADLKLPKYDVTTGRDAFLDPSEYEFDALELTDSSLSRDREWSGKLDVKRLFALEEGTFEVQGGAKLRLRKKSFDLTQTDFDGFDGDFTLADVAGGQSYGLALIDPVADPLKVRSFFDAHRDAFEVSDVDSTFDSASGDYDVRENIYAGYLMGRYDNGSVRVVGGVRMEHTRNRIMGNVVELVEEDSVYNGEVLDEDTVFITPVEFRRRYTDWLPSLNIRYEPVKDVVLRAGVSRSVVRPNIGDIAPRFIVEQNDDGDREGEFGNPALKPYRAWNVDLSAEWYFDTNAVLQAGFFYKTIDNFIARVEVEDISFNGIFVNEAVIPINGESATVKGLEFGYQQSLTFLPAPFDGLLLGFNYTYTDARGDVNGRKVPLPASAKNTFNAMIGYEKGPFSIRLAGTYRDVYLDELGDDADEDRYVKDHFQFDVTVKYRVTKNFQVFAEFVNLNNAPYVAFQRGPGADRLLQSERYSWTGKFGAKATF
jgi:TonB-dependent receptor